MTRKVNGEKNGFNNRITQKVNGENGPKNIASLQQIEEFGCRVESGLTGDINSAH